MSKIIDIYEMIMENNIVSNKKKECRIRFIASLILLVTSTIMLGLNIYSHAELMTKTSVVLIIGFALSALFAGLFKNEKISAVIIAILVGIVFSVFAISAGNEGFAILWILLVPVFAIGMIGVRMGVTISVYFLILLFVLFYSPLQAQFVGKYTESFISKFPFLYFCDFVLAMFFSLQREYFYKKLQLQSYYDGMTGAFNRFYFMQKLGDPSISERDDFIILMLDLNGLKKANDTLGHEAGDELLKGVVDCCKKTFGKHSLTFRMGGDEFSVILNMKKEAFEPLIQQLKDEMDFWKGKYNKKLSFAMGYALKAEHSELSSEELLKIADQEMYENKSNFYKQSGNDRRNR